MRRGFTLIELLVVIAIIGILSSVVLASLDSARTKGNDASAKSNLEGTRAQAALYYDANSNTYTGACGTTAVNGVKTIYTQVYGAATAEGLSTVQVNATGGSGKATCNATASAWAAEVPLKSAGFYCVDNTGISATTSASTLTSATDAACN